MEGWFSLTAAQALFEQAGLDFEEEKRKAQDRSFTPVSLGTSAKATIYNELRNVDSSNVIAKVEGSEAPDEYVLYMGHWDHLGTQESIEGDNIFNGAYDNATGISGLVELGRAFAALEPAPRRSILFVAVTAEEQGLLGSRYYAEHPLYPAAQTVGAINMDGLNVWGRTKDVTVVGMGQSSLDDLAAELALAQGRRLIPDPELKKGSTIARITSSSRRWASLRSTRTSAWISEGQSPEWGEEQRERYVAEDYHKPSDEVKEWYELSGMVLDLELFYAMGHRLATTDVWPEWSETSEFRARREASRQP